MAASGTLVYVHTASVIVRKAMVSRLAATGEGPDGVGAAHVRVSAWLYVQLSGAHEVCRVAFVDILASAACCVPKEPRSPVAVVYSSLNVTFRGQLDILVAHVTLTTTLYGGVV